MSKQKAISQGPNGGAVLRGGWNIFKWSSRRYRALIPTTLKQQKKIKKKNLNYGAAALPPGGGENYQHSNETEATRRFVAESLVHVRAFVSKRLFILEIAAGSKGHRKSSPAARANQDSEGWLGILYVELHFHVSYELPWNRQRHVWTYLIQSI